MKKFTLTHDWVEIETERTLKVGISQVATQFLEDIIFIELPNVGEDVKVGDVVAVLESSKAAADIYSPVSGVIVAVNTSLKENPSLITKSPEEKGWIYKITIQDVAELSLLLDENQYRQKPLEC